MRLGLLAAAALLTADGFDNHSVHYLPGPRNYSMTDARAVIADAIGRPDLPYVPFSYDDAKQGMMQAGLSESTAGLYDEMTRSLNEEKIMVNEIRTAENTTPTTLETFVGEVFAPVFKGA